MLQVTIFLGVSSLDGQTAIIIRFVRDHTWASKLKILATPLVPVVVYLSLRRNSLQC